MAPFCDALGPRRKGGPEVAVLGVKWHSSCCCRDRIGERKRERERERERERVEEEEEEERRRRRRRRKKKKKRKRRRAIVETRVFTKRQVLEREDFDIKGGDGEEESL